MRKLVIASLLFAGALMARADGLDSLEQFIRSAKSGRADFTQVVTSPGREGQASRSKTSSGTFEFARPNRFRFDYRKPFPQTIVADGQTLWLYDADLNQVTARQQSAVLGSTPAALIASAADVGQLRKDFKLEAAGEKDGLQWVLATPLAKDGQLHSIRLGFRGEEVAALEILDSFGQRSVLTFSKMELNVPVAADQFRFKPPQGAQVLRQ
ncbi:outer membrane lipoprotein chaperone LolA [Ramlibacter solisilvae]|uniref:Outer-membrane lipoprotein carrier protein n=1 Tax=Ramlibacter tataouinensis TaxID=94132 RepID=A0A127JQQ2_9BURK|nr:outer membrane lipoprotein chaperone LolA [Ramlibacter tataouinensis]AMO22279.1 membrane protein [Ramlibacter tataouinensis]